MSMRTSSSVTVDDLVGDIEVEGRGSKEGGGCCLGPDVKSLSETYQNNPSQSYIHLQILYIHILWLKTLFLQDLLLPVAPSSLVWPSGSFSTFGAIKANTKIKKCVHLLSHLNKNLV